MDDYELFGKLYSNIEDFPIQMRGVKIIDDENRREVSLVSGCEFIDDKGMNIGGVRYLSVIPKNIPWEYYLIYNDPRGDDDVFQLLSEVINMNIDARYWGNIHTLKNIPCRLFIDWYCERDTLKLSQAQLQIHREGYDDRFNWEEIQKPGLLTKAAK